MILKSQRWRKTAVATLVGALFAMSASGAFALALGRVTVQSALGEPLRAEIDIPELNADEAATLRATVASPEAFKAAGLEYNAALGGAQISLQRRSDGRAYIRLVSDRPVSEPFVDLILEASWATGRVVRDYTMLLDPPSLRTVPPAPAVVAPQVATAPNATSAPAPVPVARAPVPVRRATVEAPPKAAKPATDGGKQVTVRAGDTASRIAAANKPARVSLDQMLVALLRANPDAFANENLNRLKAGAVLTIPGEDQARAVTPAEASTTVIAQSRDFNDFRGKLAANAPAVPVAAADRKVSGALQAKVEDKKPAATTPDKLTLSKGTAQSKAAEEKIAKEQVAKDAAKRAAELSKNIKDLGSIGTASGTASTAAPAPAAPAAPTIPAAVTVAPAPPVAVPSAPAVAVAVAVAPVVAPSAAAAPIVAAPVAQPPKPAAVPPTPGVSTKTASEPGFIDGLIDSPLVLAAGGALVALLAGLGIYRSRQRKKTADVDSAFLESRLQPDSFFGASGGQKVDTNDGAATGSSMVYSPSQLDAADDVDPVAEADVYLAYGRDLQAEEILKEALRTHAGRIAVHQKLLDIYAKRRDAKSFEGMASEAFKLAGPQSPEWARICEQGLTIDPANPLYQPGGLPSMSTQPLQAAAVAAAVATVAMAGSGATQKIDRAVDPAPVSASMDLDLDLDFSLDEVSSPSTIIEAQPTRIEPTIALMAVPSAPAPLDMDFGLSTEALNKPVVARPGPAPVELALPDLTMADSEKTMSLSPTEVDEFRQQAEVSFGSTDPAPLQSMPAASPSGFAPVDAPLPDVSFGVTVPNTLTASQAPLNQPDARDSGMLEFDLGTLSLELDAPPASSTAAPSSEAEDPLVTKLALAEEFVSIGDDDGARALIEEVIAEASGDLKAKAQRALSSLG